MSRKHEGLLLPRLIALGEFANELLANVVRDSDFNTTQFLIAFHFDRFSKLADAEASMPLTPTAVAQLMMCPPGRVLAQLKEMRKRGDVVATEFDQAPPSTDSAGDGRHRFYRLTVQGRERLLSLVDELVSIEELIRAALPRKIEDGLATFHCDLEAASLNGHLQNLRAIRTIWEIGGLKKLRGGHRRLLRRFSE
ncbi:hypothetical protein GNX71_28265 [Variovorax sp. RKNM96]|uniref:hypothetical protein n=1 Tax=Variovorax sp. RKNM96 TaxID=2681552 RepID=UPI001980BCD5|nr:hypothetical protein [Variovorax sp. RKNM96]QSI33253.1 hypothetical protein GNX71_28265 [Variovorax sp. RKNM96]